MTHEAYLGSFAAEITDVPKRDIQRLKKEPFKTMIPPKDQKAIDDLRGWVEPRTAYVMMESIEYHLKHDATMVKCGGIFVYTVEARPNHQVWKIKEYQKKGWRVIHYANFPKLNDPNNPARAAKALMHSGPDKKNPWDTLAADVEQLMRENPDVAETLKAKEAEVDELKAKLAAMEKKVGKDK